MLDIEKVKSCYEEYKTNLSHFLDIDRAYNCGNRTRTLPTNHGSPTINSLANIAITEGSTTLQIRCGASGATYYTTFSYPVAE